MYSWIRQTQGGPVCHVYISLERSSLVIIQAVTGTAEPRLAWLMSTDGYLPTPLPSPLCTRFDRVHLHPGTAAVRLS